MTLTGTWNRRWVGMLAVGALLVSLAAVVNLSEVRAHDSPWQPVAQAECGPEDRPETGLQGQVPPAERATLFGGFNCNLELVGQYAGDGAGWQMAWYGDCAYYGGATWSTVFTRDTLGNGEPRPLQDDPGTAVIDASDVTNPRYVERLTTASMIDPWESLKVSQDRGILAAQNSNNGNGGPEVDVYDVSADCAEPELLFSGPVGESVGHSGTLSADGTIYYGSPLNASDGTPKAVDITDPTDPWVITEDFPVGTHDLSTNADGTRLYLANTRGNGLAILDTTEVQERRENPEVRVISELYWPDGATAQMTQPITINDTPYILFVDEGVSGLNKWSSCQDDLPPYGTARLIDISDERNPQVTTRLDLETHLPENCAATVGDTQNALFGYDGHYCTASDGEGDSTTGPVEDAVIIACSYFESGLRVFDVRDPENPQEIAYYNPPARPGYHTASYSNASGVCTSADWTAAHPRVRADRGEIWFTSQCNGFQIVTFTNEVWPLAPVEG